VVDILQYIKKALAKQSSRRIVTYRILSIVSEFIIVWIVTGSLLIPSITTPICILVHTGLHWLVEKLWK